MNTKERELLSPNSYYFKQLFDWRKVTIEFDIYGSKADIGDSDKVLMQCREDNINKFGEFLRHITSRENGPCDVTITGPDKQQLVRIRKGVTFTKHKFDIFDSSDRSIGYFFRKTSYFKSPEYFEFYSASGQVQYVLRQGEDNERFFCLYEGQKVLATITKDRGEGIKEKVIQAITITSADDYFVELSERVPKSSVVRQVVLAAVIIFDYSFYSAASNV